MITWSFDPSHWVATRFSDGRRFGAWYGSTELETTVHETVYHWHRFLMDSFPTEDRVITADRRVCDVRADATLVDLRGREIHTLALVSRSSYVLTQQVGAFVHGRGDAGLVVRSARCEGTNVAMLDRTALSDVRERCFLTYRCNPRADTVEVGAHAGAQVDGCQGVVALLNESANPEANDFSQRLPCRHPGESRGPAANVG